MHNKIMILFKYKIYKKYNNMDYNLENLLQDII